MDFCLFLGWKVAQGFKPTLPRKYMDKVELVGFGVGCRFLMFIAKMLSGCCFHLIF